jgi:hypothetical protein
LTSVYPEKHQEAEGSGNAGQEGSGVDSAHENVIQIDSWDGLASAEDLRRLSRSFSADRLRDLQGVLEGCPVELRARVLAEVFELSHFGDRAILLALARVAHDTETARGTS